MAYRVLRWTTALACVILYGITLFGCAVPVNEQPTSELRRVQDAKQFRVLEQTAVKLSTGYETTIKSQSKWTLVGIISQGEVYKSRDQVLTVEGYDVDEAYLVLSSDELVGFYLPVKHTFAPISPAKQLRLER